MSCRVEEQAAGRFYRLPTAAEWELCCRAGTASAFSAGGQLTSPQANVRAPLKKTALSSVEEVGRFAPNAWGLHDMHGNVAEWCGDWFAMKYYTKAAKIDPRGPASGAGRVVRGGCWNDRASNCRSASRGVLEPNRKSNSIGFRVVCETYQPLDGPAKAAPGTRPLAVRLHTRPTRTIESQTSLTDVIHVRHLEVPFGALKSHLVSLHRNRQSKYGRLSFWFPDPAKAPREIAFPNAGANHRVIALGPKQRHLVVYNQVYELKGRTGFTKVGDLHFTIRVFDKRRKEFLNVRNMAKPSHVEFSNDGKTVAADDAVWEIPSGKRIRKDVKWGGGWKNEAGSQYVTVVGNKVTRWNARANKPLSTVTLTDLAGKNVFHSLGHPISRDGKVLIGRAGPSEVGIWDLDSGQQLRKWKAHDEGLGPVVISPDGKYIATAGQDVDVKIWDAASGRYLMTISGHGARVEGLDFNPEGRGPRSSPAPTTGRSGSGTCRSST